MVLSAFLSGCLIPAWILPKTQGGLSASGFMLQFFVQGAWGVIPIHLNELSPPAFRSSFPGRKSPFLKLIPNANSAPLVTYQLGNMISSPSAQIVNAVAESVHISGAGGPDVPAYGPTMAVATAIIVVGIMVTASVGPEKRGSHFESAVIGQQTAAIHAESKAADLEGGEKEKVVEMERFEKA